MTGQASASPRAFCDLCGAASADAQSMLHHLRVMHPERYQELETWPDGSIVVSDNTLTPDDFAGGS